MNAKVSVPVATAAYLRAWLDAHDVDGYDLIRALKVARPFYLALIKGERSLLDMKQCKALSVFTKGDISPLLEIVGPPLEVRSIDGLKEAGDKVVIAKGGADKITNIETNKDEIEVLATQRLVELIKRNGTSDNIKFNAAKTLLEQCRGKPKKNEEKEIQEQADDSEIISKLDNLVPTVKVNK